VAGEVGQKTGPTNTGHRGDAFKAGASLVCRDFEKFRIDYWGRAGLRGTVARM
jgi:hypothetical protein